MTKEDKIELTNILGEGRFVEITFDRQNKEIYINTIQSEFEYGDRVVYQDKKAHDTPNKFTKLITSIFGERSIYCYLSHYSGVIADDDVVLHTFTNAYGGESYALASECSYMVSTSLTPAKIKKLDQTKVNGWTIFVDDEYIINFFKENPFKLFHLKKGQVLMVNESTDKYGSYSVYAKNSGYDWIYLCDIIDPKSATQEYAEKLFKDRSKEISATERILKK